MRFKLPFIKKVDILLIRSYIGPFAVTFFLSMFLFLMQFLWKFIDELVGKGISFDLLLKLIFFSLADLVPMALPLTIMVAGLMTFGNLSESFELVAMKSNGISLLRALRPIFLLMCCLAVLNFLFLNYIIPKAKLEQAVMLIDMRQKKPTFNISEGVFYHQIEGFAIRVGTKEKDNQTLRDVLIYEYKQDDSKRLNVMRAEWGKMLLSPDHRTLNLTLYNGVRYEEMTNSSEYSKTQPFNQMFFEKQSMAIDLSSLDFQFTDRDLIATDYRLQNVSQLFLEIDTFHLKCKKLRDDNSKYLGRYLHVPGLFLLDSQQVSFQRGHAEYKLLSNKQIIKNFPSQIRQSIISAAINHARSVKSMAEGLTGSLQFEESEVNLYRSELHKKFAFSFLVVLLFLISAPLGAIIRKGGIGMPLVISVLLFVVFYALNLTGEKMGKAGIVSVWLGSWLSSMLLLPVGLIITYRASIDKSFHGSNPLSNLAAWLKKWIAMAKKLRIGSDNDSNDRPSNNPDTAIQSNLET
ncbi:MAG: YjgP/YjgQ family permease [Flavobacteriaceae bacterium]|nr:YjgP/YjgQ family permease [Flavobacteriaceae bacterium]